MDVLGDAVQARAQLGLLAAERHQLGVPTGPRLLGAGQHETRLGGAAVGGAHHGGQGLGDGGGPRDLTTADHLAAGGLLRGGVLRGQAALERDRALLLGADALARGLDLQARLDLGFARRFPLGDERVAAARVEHGPRAGSGLLERATGGVVRGDGLLHRRAREVEAALHAGELGGGGLGLRAGSAEPLGVGGEARVGLAQAAERRGCPLAGGTEALPSGREVHLQVVDAGADVGQRGRGGLARGDELELGAGGAGSAAQHVRRHDLARAGDRRGGCVGSVEEGDRLREAVDEDDVREDPPHAVRCLDHGGRGDGTVG